MSNIGAPAVLLGSPSSDDLSIIVPVVSRYLYA